MSRHQDRTTMYYFSQRKDLDTLRQLAREMEGELAVLETSVNQLESSTAFLEDYQFSVTTKLKGEVAFTFGGAN